MLLGRRDHSWTSIGGIGDWQRTEILDVEIAEPSTPPMTVEMRLGCSAVRRNSKPTGSAARLCRANRYEALAHAHLHPRLNDCGDADCPFATKDDVAGLRAAAL